MRVEVNEVAVKGVEGEVWREDRRLLMESMMEGTTRMKERRNVRLRERKCLRRSLGEAAISTV